MENNQQTNDLATTVLTQIYADYQKEKKWARIYKYIYYGALAIAIALIFALKPGHPTNDLSLQDKSFVAVMKMHGGVGPDEEINFEDFEPFIEQTFKNPNVVGLVLDIDSPGGGVYDTYMIYEKFQQMKQKYPEKKITTYIRSLSASAGYWISVSSDKIYASPVSIIGSIGVRTGYLPDLSEFVKEHKIKFTTFQAGRFKTMGDPMRPLTEEETNIIQENIEECYQMFTNIIQTRRGDRLDKTDPDLFSGLTWRAPTALKKGLIDCCDVSFDDMIKVEYGDYHYSYVKRKDLDFSLGSFIKELRESLFYSVKTLESATNFSNQTLYV